MGNFSDNPSQRGNTERNSMSEIFTICQTWLNIRQHRWQKHCKSWNMRKSLRNQTLLYNIGITQERSPISKMTVRKFYGRQPSPDIQKLTWETLSVSWSFRSLFTPVRLRTQRGWLQRWEQIQKLPSEVMFQQMSDYWYWDRTFKYMKAFKRKFKENLFWGK